MILIIIMNIFIECKSDIDASADYLVWQSEPGDSRFLHYIYIIMFPQTEGEMMKKTFSPSCLCQWKCVVYWLGWRPPLWQEYVYIPVSRRDLVTFSRWPRYASMPCTWHDASIYKMQLHIERLASTLSGPH